MARTRRGKDWKEERDRRIRLTSWWRLIVSLHFATKQRCTTRSRRISLLDLGTDRWQLVAKILIKARPRLLIAIGEHVTRYCARPSSRDCQRVPALVSKCRDMSGPFRATDWQAVHRCPYPSNKYTSGRQRTIAGPAFRSATFSAFQHSAERKARLAGPQCSARFMGES